MRSIPRSHSVWIGYGSRRSGAGGCLRRIGCGRLYGIVSTAFGVPEGALPQPDRPAAEARRHPMQANRCESPRSRNGMRGPLKLRPWWMVLHDSLHLF